MKSDACGEFVRGVGVLFLSMGERLHCEDFRLRASRLRTRSSLSYLGGVVNVFR